MAKLVDAPDLGSGVLQRAGSSPVRRTTGKEEIVLDVSSFLFSNVETNVEWIETRLSYVGQQRTI